MRSRPGLRMYRSTLSGDEVTAVAAIPATTVARTLLDLNNCLPEPISDHSPMTVDLPFGEPTELSAKAQSK